jgi:hypothetical protein
MVPIADTINHENVDTHYECLDMEGKPINESKKVKKELRRKQRLDHLLKK